MKKSLPVDKAVIRAKIKAASLHFLLSLLIFSLALCWILQILYPSFHFRLNGGIHALQLLVSVDLVLGPLLTLLVYHPLKGKREKTGDFAVIGLVQLAALAYGLNALYQEHPKMLAFYDYGRTEVITRRAWEANPTPLDGFTSLGGVPVGVYRTDTGQYVPLDLAALAKGDRSFRETMLFEEKSYLSHLEQQHGRLYVLAAAGKYKSEYLALDDKMNIVSEFGEKDVY